VKVTTLTKTCKICLLRNIASFRGIQLGRPELVKTWEKFEQKKSVKAEKEKNSDSELESRFRSISQKQEVRITTCTVTVLKLT